MGTILIANYSLAVLCLERVGKKLLLGKNNRQCNLSSKWKDSFGKNVKKLEKRENILNYEKSHIPKERVWFFLPFFIASWLFIICGAANSLIFTRNFYAMQALVILMLSCGNCGKIITAISTDLFPTRYK